MVWGVISPNCLGVLPSVSKAFEVIFDNDKF